MSVVASVVPFHILMAAIVLSEMLLTVLAYGEIQSLKKLAEYSARIFNTQRQNEG